MLVLDTNVVSELLRPAPSLAVVRWLKAQQRATLFITTPTQAELLEGVARLPKGKRQVALAAAVQAILAEDFANQILPFDEPAAASYAGIAAERRRSGRPLAIFDGLIASICLARGMALATRNGADFEGCGVTLIDPWRA